jgi:hypothetical protein
MEGLEDGKVGRWKEERWKMKKVKGCLMKKVEQGCLMFDGWKDGWC